ncbi:MAG: hypothetical protein MPJ50_07880 [Pirellulales bacterium]|nr:hypothetical protein [Pirellulales bacterium]
MSTQSPARICLLSAKNAPYAAVIRRKPTKVSHVIHWDTRRDRLEYGSWFRGRLYPFRSDISPDGRYMIYFAMGATGETWNGLCELPFLKTIVHVDHGGTYYGGGYWVERELLRWNAYLPKECKRLPFGLQEWEPRLTDDFGVLLPKLARDGWEMIDRHVSGQTIVLPPGPLAGTTWRNQPSREHPALLMQYRGYSHYDRLRFFFSLQGYGDLLDDAVDSACWDSRGNLLYSRAGTLNKVTLKQLQRNRPGTKIDLEHLVPPDPPQPE